MAMREMGMNQQIGKKEPLEAISDDAVGMLAKVGEFVEPLTRFDRSHLELVSCATDRVTVTATQSFRVSFASQTVDGAGSIPSGVKNVSNAGALNRELAAMLARAEEQASKRLLAWSEERGSDARATLAEGDVFASEGRIGFAWKCEQCGGEGSERCSACRGTGNTSCATCSGAKKITCGSCHGSGHTPCSGCNGLGQQTRQVAKSGWNPVANEKTVTYETVRETCHICNGQRTEQCMRCNGQGVYNCPACLGIGTSICSSCGGRRQIPCGACKGHGESHRVSSIVCRVEPELSVAVDGSNEEIRSELSVLRTVDQILALASDTTVRYAAEEGATFIRTTQAQVRAVSAIFKVGTHRLNIHGYGEHWEIFDFKDIGAALLSGDIESLEAALTDRTGLVAALARMLESETHTEIARRSGAWSKTKRASAMTNLSAEFRGIASPDYALRASNVIRKGMGRLYRTTLMRWPVTVMGIPVLALPANWLAWHFGMRDEDLPVILGTMLLTFAGAFAGHLWATGVIQRQLANRQDLHVSELLGGLGLRRTWLIVAGLEALLVTPIFGALGRVWAGF